MSKLKFISVICASAALVLAAGCDDAKKATPDSPKTQTAEQVKKDETGASATPTSAKTANTKPVPFTAVGPIAKVDGEEVSAELFNTEVESMMKMMPMMPAAQVQSIKPRIIDNVINKFMIEKATKPELANVKQTDVDAEYKKFEENAGQRPGGAAAMLAQMGMDETQFKTEMKKSLALKLVLEKKSPVTPTDADVKKFYEENKARFEEPDQVKASHILFKVAKEAPAEEVKKAEKEAKDVYKLAKKKDADFAELAKKHSQGPTAPKGGDLGFFEAKRMVPEFSEAAFKMKPGQVSKPVRTQFGFHVIKVTDKKKKRTVPMAEVKDQITNQLEQTKMRDAVKTYIDDLRASAKIEKIDANVKDNPEFAKQAHTQSPMGMPGMPNMPKGMPNQKLKLPANMKKGQDGKLKLTPPPK